MHLWGASLCVFRMWSRRAFLGGHDASQSLKAEDVAAIVGRDCKARTGGQRCQSREAGGKMQARDTGVTSVTESLPS